MMASASANSTSRTTMSIQGLSDSTVLPHDPH
jgi:hypothetical protein